MMIFPNAMIPVPNWVGSATPPPSGVLAITISAVTVGAIGSVTVPTSRTPGAPIPSAPAMTCRLVTVRRVLSVGANRNTPSIATVYATADVLVMVTV